MKQNLVLLCIVFASVYTYANDSDCSNAHSSVNYVILHTKKALEANNFEHQKYYAQRALEAFEKTSVLMEKCDCQDAKSASYDGPENLKNAVDPVDWDQGRYYTKNALEHARNLISALDNCSTEGDRDDYSSESSSDTSSLAMAENEILVAQQKLLQKQQELLEEQKQLEAKLKQQKIKIEQQKQARSLELQQQSELKAKAEQALESFERSILELAQALDCKDAYSITFESYKRAEKALESESLTGTKKYYTEKAKDIASKALSSLQDCAF